MKIPKFAIYISVFVALFALIVFLHKRSIDGFITIPDPKPIPRFVVMPPVIPKRPPPSTNSNGGLVSIS